MYKKLSEVEKELTDLRNNGRQRGKSIGWDWNNMPLTIKEGCTTYLGAAPASGKTELWLEILINLSCVHSWKHIIFTPETGDFKDVYSELCHKFIGKGFIKGFNAMNEVERVYAESFIDEHFVVIDPLDKDLTIIGFYELVDKIESELGTTFNTTTIDPWNELSEEYLPEDLGREDKYLSRILGKVRRNARTTNRHNCIITHVRDQAQSTVDGISFYPAPHARELAGGQVWFRKGLSMLMQWRPPLGLSSKNGVPYTNNELHLIIAKSKPKGVSTNGVYTLYFDVDKSRYYMLDDRGNRVYSDRGKYNEVKEEQKILPLKPNKEFDINHTIEPKKATVSKDDEWLQGYMEEEEFKI